LQCLKVVRDSKKTKFLSLAFEIMDRLPPISSQQAFARILRLYLKPLDRKVNLKKAIEIAEESVKLNPPLPSRLFKELAEALKEELNAEGEEEKQKAKKEVKEAIVRLFYYHF